MCLSAVGIVASELFVPDLDPAKMKEKRNFNFFSHFSYEDSGLYGSTIV